MRPKRPVIIGGTEFRSSYAASKALGISRKTIESALRAGRGLDDFRPYRRAIVIDGTRYESIKDASRILGIPDHALYRRVRKHGPILDSTPTVLRRGREVTIDGKTYPSIAAAARATGINYHKLWRSTR